MNEHRSHNGSGWVAEEGTPFPLGASWIETGRAWNFAITSRHAERVTLLLYSKANPAEPVLERTLDYLQSKSGHIWHCRVPKDEAPDAYAYAWRFEGPGGRTDLGWHGFDSEKVLLDPYAEAVWFPPGFDRARATVAGDNSGAAPLGVLPAPGSPLIASFDWGEAPQPKHERDLVIYELHVRGFTMHESSGVDPERRGTYLGVIDKIPYLKDLGITAVELMPVFQWDPQERNYWGYAPINFFAPSVHFSAGKTPEAAVVEFKQMVRALHEAGIEVILDVVYNHTGEGGINGPTYSWRGIDNASYYLHDDDPAKRYFDVTGTGNTVAANDRFARRMIVDSLLHWAREYRVDGFRFDLAAFALRNTDGSLNLTDPPIVGDIMQRDELLKLRLIEEPWDAAGLYQLGLNSPTRMGSQWNDQFRDDVRRFVRGDAGMTEPVSLRVQGSPDLFPHGIGFCKHPWQSVNLVTAHDGFTLYDLVSYNKKHNEANGEGNADGLNENYSFNHGFEGDTGVTAAVRALRTQQAKNMLALLLLSAGTPMITAGDEGLRTQGGNNNAWNQDNATSWIDWARLEEHAEVTGFVKKLLAFRAGCPTLVRSRFWREDVAFYGLDTAHNFMPEDRALAYRISGASVGGPDLYIAANMLDAELPFTVCGAEPGERWGVELATGREPTLEAAGDATRFELAAKSIALLFRVG